MSSSHSLRGCAWRGPGPRRLGPRDDLVRPSKILLVDDDPEIIEALRFTLESKGYTPKKMETHATCVMSPQEGGGFAITGMQLKVRGTVPGLDNATFVEIAHEADKGCPVSNLLRNGLTIKLDAALA